MKTVFFDLDGTLTDPKTGIISCLRYALEKIGSPVEEDLTWCIGPPLHDSLAIILNGDRPVKAGDEPVQMNGITGAGEYRAKFKLTDDGWKISRMESEGFFIGPGFVK